MDGGEVRERRRRVREGIQERMRQRFGGDEWGKCTKVKKKQVQIEVRKTQQ